MFITSKLNNYIQDENTELTYKNNKLNDEIVELKNEINELKKKEKHIFLGELLYTRPDNVKIYVSSCRQLFPNLKIWEYNRELDENHKNNLKDIIKNNKCLEGNIDILECNNELCIVNGQHRYNAIYRH